MTCLLFLWKRAPCNLSPKLQGATANKKLPYFMVPKALSVWRIIHPLGREDCLTSRARRRSCRSSQSCFPWLSQLLSSSPNTFGCWWRICHNPLCTGSLHQDWTHTQRMLAPITSHGNKFLVCFQMSRPFSLSEISCSTPRAKIHSLGQHSRFRVSLKSTLRPAGSLMGNFIGVSTNEWC